MRNPDFMIIGAMKSGTSTLYDQLARQAGIFMTTPKEPAFFADDAIYARGADWYGGLYAGAPADALCGEASTHYTKLPTYPKTVARMQAMNLSPKLIYVIRNPIQRAMSHYLHERSQGVMEGDLVASFDQHPELVEYGLYAKQIAPFVEAFGKDAVHLSSLEQLKSDPDTEFAKIIDHIGVDRSAFWDHDAQPQNVSADRIRRFPLHKLLIENRVAKLLRRTLLPQSLRQKVRAARTIGVERPEWPDDLRAELEQQFTTDRAALAQVFPDHPTLDLCYPFVPS